MGNIGCAHFNGVFDYSYVNISLKCNQIEAMDTKLNIKLAKALIDKSVCRYKLAENNVLFERCNKVTRFGSCSPTPVATWSVLISFVRKSPKIRIVIQRIYSYPCTKG